MSKKKKKPEPLDPPFGRLCLVTPAEADLEIFAPLLDAALSGGDVASLLIAFDDPELTARAAEKLVPIAQAYGVAAIVVGPPALAVASHADGAHVEGSVVAVQAALAELHPDFIVGAAGIKTRHDAMIIAETEPDYLFFGKLDGDRENGIFDKALDLAAWWSAVFEIPAMVMGGRAIECVDEAVDARIEFVVLRHAIWAHAEGPREAVAEANRRIAARQAEGG